MSGGVDCSGCGVAKHVKYEGKVDGSGDIEAPDEEDGDDDVEGDRDGEDATFEGGGKGVEVCYIDEVFGESGQEGRESLRRF